MNTNITRNCYDSQRNFFVALLNVKRHIVRQDDDKERHKVKPDTGVECLEDVIEHPREVVIPRAFTTRNVDVLWFFNHEVFGTCSWRS